MITSGAASRAAREKDVLESAARTLSDPRFQQFRTLATPYLEVVRTMRPLDEKFAAGTITPEEREQYWRLDARKTELWQALHSYMYEDRWTKADRKAMGQWLSLMGSAAE